MRSICLGKPFGIPLIATSLFNLVVIMIFAGNLLAGIMAGQPLLDSLAAASSALLFLLILFSVVTVHEYGHSLTAKSLGYNVPQILLHPFGGAAIIEGDWCKSAKDEFLITVAGPGVNLVLAAIVAPWIPLSSYLDFFFAINVILFLFNALPIYPMDGGRVVRCACTWLLKGDWWRATQIAWVTGLITAVIVMPVLWMAGIWLGAILVGLVAFVLAPLEIKHLKVKWLAEEVEAVNERFRESHPESHGWMHEMSEYLVTRANAEADQFGLAADERARIRQAAERCWAVLALDDFDKEHQFWFEKARAKPASLTSKAFLTVLLLPPKAESE